MKYLILITSIFLGLFTVVINKSKAQVSLEWVRTYNAEAQGGMALDSSGNIYILGWEGSGFVTIKYNPSGDTLWKHNYFPPTLVAWPRAIATDSECNVYVSGSQWEYTTIKYDSSGIQKWIRIYNSPYGMSEVFDMVVDNKKNVYVTGQSKGSNGKNAYLTIKYNSNGDSLWTARYTGPDAGSFGRSIAVDRYGNAFVTGASFGSGTERDIATVKYDSNGIEQWVRRYNGTSNFADEGVKVKTDEIGNCYVLGIVSNIDRDFDFCLIKYFPTGDTAWTRIYGSDSGSIVHTDSGKDLVLDGTNSVYFTGWGHPAPSSPNYRA